MNTVFFWGGYKKLDELGPNCLSQWYPCKFMHDGFVYNTAEQYMMASKARLFADKKALNDILTMEYPWQQKDIGRHIKGFIPEVWDECKFYIVIRGNTLKFSQNHELMGYLLGTGDALLAEASPKDAIWGIGLDAQTAASTPQSEWPGQNLLGKALMEVRECLKGWK